MGFEKICNGCIYYAVQYEFCSMKYIRIGKMWYITARIIGQRNEVLPDETVH